MILYGYEFLRDSDLVHHGILGMKWGVRRYQNPDGTLTSAGKRHKRNLESGSMERDVKWAKRHEKRIIRQATKKTKRDMAKIERKELKPIAKRHRSGKDSKAYINAYNKRLAELMNTSMSDLETPSGRAVRFIAKRGDLGVYLAVADKGYNMNQVKNGVYASGRIAYKKDSVNKG